MFGFLTQSQVQNICLRCKGDELHLLRCPHTALPTCGIAEVAGVTCIQNEGDKLVNWSLVKPINQQYFQVIYRLYLNCRFFNNYKNNKIHNSNNIVNYNHNHPHLSYYK